MITTRIALPKHFQRADFLAFHQRDTQMLAERVHEQGMEKGLVWQGSPACLGIEFEKNAVHVSLAIDKPAKKPSQENTELALQQLVKHMLGLDQPTHKFRKNFSAHPHLGKLLTQQPGLRVPQSATPFEALTWAITGQQISVSAAISVRRRFIEAIGLRHSSGIGCHPSAAEVAGLDESILRQAGFSQTKANTLIALSNAIVTNALPLDQWLQDAWNNIPLPVEEIRAQLIGIRGIGHWTINYTLLRGFGWLDGSLHGDAAVRRNLQLLLNSNDKLTLDATEQWLAEFAPWRALVAAHLWAMQRTEGF